MLRGREGGGGGDEGGGVPDALRGREDRQGGAFQTC